MTELRNNNIKSQDSFSTDAFGRWRVSEPYSVFDSKQISSEHLSLLWDIAEVSGSGTSYMYNPDRASTTLSVSDNTQGTIIRQTLRKFNYQPGKSQEIMTTFVNLHTELNSGISKCVGYFDDYNGIFLTSDNGVNKIVRRSQVNEPSAGIVDYEVEQDSWNLDKMDGTGKSGITLDLSKSQIFFIDIEWLGVGRVRCGFVIDGKIYYTHEFLNANNLDSVYMTSPNLPIRYEISNDGTGGSEEIECICSSIISEGGFEPHGILQSHATKTNLVQAQTGGTFYALIGIGLKTNQLFGSVFLDHIIMGVDSNDLTYWELRLNPFVASTFNYSDKTNSIVQIATGNTITDPSPNTVTGGTVMDAGYVTSHSGEIITARNSLLLGSKIDGTTDKIVLCASPVGTGPLNLDISGGIVWREVV